MVWQFNEALTLSHVWSVIFVVPSYSWYTQLAVHIYAPILATNYNLKSGHSFKTSFIEVNYSLTPAVLFEFHQPKLINRLSRSSLRMPLAEANRSFILVIHPKLINRLSRSSLRMPLAEANHLFVPVIPSNAISRSYSIVCPGHPLGCH